MEFNNSFHSTYFSKDQTKLYHFGSGLIPDKTEAGEFILPSSQGAYCFRTIQMSNLGEVFKNDSWQGTNTS